jgi:hypothetical protein
VWATSAELKDRKVVRLLPTITLQEMLLAFKDVVVRSEMFAHHHIQRERLSVRARMGDILSTLEHSSFVEFARLFRPEEGRMGITVTFVAILELVREGLIDIVQAEPFAPLHVRAAGANRTLRVVAGSDAVALDEAEGATAFVDDGFDEDDEDEELEDEAADAADAASVEAANAADIANAAFAAGTRDLKIKATDAAASDAKLKSVADSANDEFAGTDVAPLPDEDTDE